MCFKIEDGSGSEHKAYQYHFTNSTHPKQMITGTKLSNRALALDDSKQSSSTRNYKYNALCNSD